MTDAEIETALQEYIDEYVGYEIDWTDPPGSASLALDRMKDNIASGKVGIGSESIGDYSVSYVTSQAFDSTTLSFLKEIRKLKW